MSLSMFMSAVISIPSTATREIDIDCQFLACPIYVMMSQDNWLKVHNNATLK